MNDSPDPSAAVRFEDLLRLAKGNGSWYDLENKIPRNEDGKPAVTWKRLEQMANKGIEEIPRKSTIAALASATGIAESDWRDAAVISIGGVPRSRQQRKSLVEILLPADAYLLDQEDVGDVVLPVINGLLRHRRAARKRP